MSLEDAILAVLREHGPCYSLQIRNHLIANNVPDPKSAIYVTLRDLERDGLIEHEERYEAPVARGGRPRIYYRLTGKRRPHPDAAPDTGSWGGLVPA